MAAYPSYPQLVETTLERDSGIQIDVMESGVIRGSALYDKPLVEFRVMHLLSDTDLLSLLDFEQSVAGQPVQFSYDGDPQATVYDAVIRRINYRWHVSGKYWVDVEMTGTAQ